MGDWKIIAAPGSQAGLAPNITSAAASVFYGLHGNDAAFGFQGTITLPTGDPNYGHLKRIQIIAALVGSGKPGFDIATLSAPFTGPTVDFISNIYPEFPQTEVVQNWTLTYLCENDNSIVTGSSFVSSLTVDDYNVLTVAANDVPGLRYPQIDNRLIWTTIFINPQMSHTQVGRNVTYWISSDNGLNWVGIGPVIMTFGGFTVQRLAPGVDQTWKVAVAPGFLDTSPTPSSSALPITAKISPSFPVQGFSTPSPFAVVSATVGTYSDATRDDGSHYGVISGLTYLDPGPSNLDFFVRVTASIFDVNSQIMAAFPEQSFAGTQITGTSHTTGPLLFDYLPGMAGVQFRIYVANRNSQGDNDFKNPVTNTLQLTCFGGNSFGNVSVTPPANTNLVHTSVHFVANNLTTDIHHVFNPSAQDIEAFRTQSNLNFNACVITPNSMVLYTNDPNFNHPAAALAKAGVAGGCVKVFTGAGFGNIDGFGLRCIMDGSNGHITADGFIDAVNGASVRTFGGAIQALPNGLTPSSFQLFNTSQIICGILQLNTTTSPVSGILQLGDGSGFAQMDGLGTTVRLQTINTPPFGNLGYVQANGGIQSVGGKGAVGQYNVFGAPAAVLAQSGNAGLVKAFNGLGFGGILFTAGGASCVMDGSTGRITCSGGYFDGAQNQVVGPRQSFVQLPSGGTVVDNEARSALINLIFRLSATFGGHGLIA